MTKGPMLSKQCELGARVAGGRVMKEDLKSGLHLQNTAYYKK